MRVLLPKNVWEHKPDILRSRSMTYGLCPREIRCVVHAATIKSFPDVFMTLAGIVTRDLSASSYSDRLLELMWEHVGFEIDVPRGQN